MSDLDEYAPTVQRIAALDEQIEALTAEREQLKDALKEGLDPDTYDIAGLRVRITQTRRLDSKKVTAAFTPSAFPDCYKPALDTRAVRARIDRLAAPEREPFFTVSTSVRLEAADHE